MKLILQGYSLAKETVTALIILYKSDGVCTSDGDTDYFAIVAGILQGDTLPPFLFINCLDYLLQISIDQMKENGLTLKTMLMI